MAGEVSAAESVALGQEGTGQAVILGQPDFGAVNYRLAEFRLQDARERKQRENEAIKGLQEYLSAPDDYFIPDTKEIMSLHEERVKFVADALRNKKDPRDPRNYEEFSTLSKMNSKISGLVNSSLQAKQMLQQARQNFDPKQHDADAFLQAAKQFTEAPSIEERNKLRPNFLVPKVSPLDLFELVPKGQKLPDTESKAGDLIIKLMSTPEGQAIYATEANKPNGAYKDPEGALKYYTQLWKDFQPKPKPVKPSKTSSGSGGGSGTKAPRIDYTYTLDYLKAGENNTDVNKAYGVVDISNAPIEYVNDPNQDKPVQFQPLAVQEDPQTGETWFYGNYIPESKNENTLNKDGSYKKISIPLKGNEQKFKLIFKGTELEDLPKFMKEKRAEALSGMDVQAQNAGAQFVTEPKTDPVDIDLQEKIYSKLPGVGSAKVKNGKLTLVGESGVSKTFDIEKDAESLKQFANGEITLNKLFLNPKSGKVAVVTNPDGSEITEAE
jgi:hypothetical protein